MMRATSSPAISPASRVACRCVSEKYAGTVITALRIGRPSRAWAISFKRDRMIAEISCGVYSRSPSCTLASLPIRRLIERTVRSG
jgi:hypothetical protein